MYWTIFIFLEKTAPIIRTFVVLKVTKKTQMSNKRAGSTPVKHGPLDSLLFKKQAMSEPDQSTWDEKTGNDNNNNNKKDSGHVKAPDDELEDDEFNIKQRVEQMFSDYQTEAARIDHELKNLAQRKSTLFQETLDTLASEIPKVYVIWICRETWDSKQTNYAHTINTTNVGVVNRNHQKFDTKGGVVKTDLKRIAAFSHQKRADAFSTKLLHAMHHYNDKARREFLKMKTEVRVSTCMEISRDLLKHVNVVPDVIDVCDQLKILCL